MHIKNDYRHAKCPCCAGRGWSFLGNISYKLPVFYSTAEVSLECVPELWKCKKCDSWFVQNVIPEERTIGLYANGSSDGRWAVEPFMTTKPSEQLECLQRYLKSGKKVLDVGCNTGELLDYARSLGCATAGIEYSISSREKLLSKGHQAFGSLDELNGEYDVITLFDLVEHLFDVSGYFSKLKKHLSPSGILIILTGDNKALSARMCRSTWWYVKYPEHVVFPSIKFFKELSGYRFGEIVFTYASVGYEERFLMMLRGFLGRVLRRVYMGLPSLGPDHMLVVLQNESRI